MALEDFKNVHTWKHCICLERLTLILPKFTSAFSSSAVLPPSTLFSKQNSLWKFLLLKTWKESPMFYYEKEILQVGRGPDTAPSIFSGYLLHMFSEGSYILLKL